MLAARIKHKLVCAADITKGSPNVLYGAASEQVLTIIDTEQILSLIGTGILIAAFGIEAAIIGYVVTGVIGNAADKYLGEGWGDIINGTLGFLALGLGAVASRRAALRETPREIPLEEPFKPKVTEEPYNPRNDPRFEDLSRDPQTGEPNAKGIDEAEAILQAERDGIVENPRRPDLSRGEPNLDYKVDGPEPYRYSDVKTPVNRGNLTEMAENMGKKITRQKGGSNDVLHVVDLKNIPPAQRAAFREAVIRSAGSSDGIVFIND